MNVLSSQPHGELGVRWLLFWTYVRLPLAGVSQVAVLALRVPPALIAASVLYLCLVLATAYGLHDRRAWAWNLNWLVLAADGTMMALGPALRFRERADQFASAFTLFLFLSVLVWIIPNTIYFLKRQKLFAIGPKSMADSSLDTEDRLEPRLHPYLRTGLLTAFWVGHSISFFGVIGTLSLGQPGVSAIIFWVFVGVWFFTPILLLIKFKHNLRLIGVVIGMCVFAWFALYLAPHFFRQILRG